MLSSSTFQKTVDKSYFLKVFFLRFFSPLNISQEQLSTLSFQLLSTSHSPCPLCCFFASGKYLCWIAYYAFLSTNKTNKNLILNPSQGSVWVSPHHYYVSVHMGVCVFNEGEFILTAMLLYHGPIIMLPLNLYFMLQIILKAA